MEDKNDKYMNFSENFVIISSRKMDFLTMLIDELKSNPEVSITPDIISEIARIVASLDPSLFVSPKEIKNGRLYLGTLPQDLDRRKIGEEIEKIMNDRIR